MEKYQTWIDYLDIAGDSKHKIKVGFCRRKVYGEEGERVTVWTDDYPRAGFLDLTNLIRQGTRCPRHVSMKKLGEVLRRYPSEAILSAAPLSI